MKKNSQTIDEVEVSVWILIALMWALVLLFSYLFWKRVSPAFPQSSRSEDALNVVVWSDPRRTECSEARPAIYLPCCLPTEQRKRRLTDADMSARCSVARSCKLRILAANSIAILTPYIQLRISELRIGTPLGTSSAIRPS